MMAEFSTVITDVALQVGELYLSIHVGKLLTSGATLFDKAITLTRIVISAINDATEAGYPGLVSEHIFECNDPMQYGYPYVYWHLYEYEFEVTRIVDGYTITGPITLWCSYYELPVLPR